MLMTPAQLMDEPLKLDESFAEDALDYAPDLRQIGPLTLQGVAELLVEHRGSRELVRDIRVRAGYAGEFEQLCARCLEPVRRRLEGNFDLIFRPVGADGGGGEHAITEDEAEIGYYEESGLLLEDAVREQVLLALPGRVLCQQDCKGLCPHCGVNRNLSTCECVVEPANPRFAALAGLSIAHER